jgi:hypothetical protein
VAYIRDAASLTGNSWIAAQGTDKFNQNKDLFSAMRLAETLLEEIK